MATQRKRASQTKRSPKTKRASQTKRGSAATSGGRFGGLGAFGRKIGGDGRWWTKTIRWVAFLGVAGILSGALSFFILYRAIAIPDENSDFQTQTTQVYYSDGKHKIGEFALQDRESVSIDEVPASMQAAAIAAEDRTFYTNRGIDFKGILRAVRDNTTSGSVQSGGSTITQQYVKILYLTQERSYTRKVKEAILSIKIHNQLSKKEILEGYLNTIYFGNGAYGIQVASQTYFGKPSSELNYAQSAMLATIINSPSYYDPYAEGASARIQPRFNYVLDGMVKSNAITAEEAAAFADKIPEVEPKRDINRFSGTRGFLLSAVRDELETKLKFSKAQIDGGGLRIVTTFDYQKQKDAVEAVKANRPAGAPELHPALVSIQPGTGAVRAMYGGPDYLKSELNWAMRGTQPGSTFKVFAVIAALEDGYSLKTQLSGSGPFVIGNAKIENQGDSGGANFGNVPLSKATAKSINTAFADLTEQMSDGGDISIGAKKVLEAAKSAGIPAAIADSIQPVAGTALGYAPVPPIDMANAYATIAADGKRAQWYMVEKVTDFQGSTMHEHKVTTEQGIPEDVAADTISAMQGVVNGPDGTGSGAKTICPTAGKTGTATGENADGSQDVSSSWFSGFTPDLATAVMYNRGDGNDELEGYMLPTFFGGRTPAATFKSYMNLALDGSDCGTFPKPANIKGDKGTVFKPPPPKCDSDERLNGAKTKCVKKPVETVPTPDPVVPTQDPVPVEPVPPTPAPTTPVPTTPPATLPPCGLGQTPGNPPVCQ